MTAETQETNGSPAGAGGAETVRVTNPATGATIAEGSQPCSGNAGILTRNATAKNSV